MKTLLALIVLTLPAAAAAQSAVFVEAAAGTHINVGGNTQSVSAGFAPIQQVAFLLNLKRLHLPTTVDIHEHGSSATRGGTTTFVSGEIRLIPAHARPVLPYALTGVGVGTSKPNVNDHSPDPVTNRATLMFFGGGIRVPAGDHLSLFADVRLTLQVERDNDGVFLFVPLRGGLAWWF